jgi:hypothetical protein
MSDHSARVYCVEFRDRRELLSKPHQIGRKLLPYLAALTLLASLIAILYPKSSNVRITDTAYKQLRNGMTLSQIKAILGGPPGDYGPGEGFVAIWGMYDNDRESESNNSGCDARYNGVMWFGKNIAISVCFDKDGRASQVVKLPVMRKESPLHSILRRIGLKNPDQFGF